MHFVLRISAIIESIGPEVCIQNFIDKGFDNNLKVSAPILKIFFFVKTVYNQEPKYIRHNVLSNPDETRMFLY